MVKSGGPGHFIFADFIVNGGGVINCGEEFAPGGYNREQALKRAAGIYDILLKILHCRREKDRAQKQPTFTPKMDPKSAEQKRMYFEK